MTVLEGTLEEITCKHGAELVGRRLLVVALPEDGRSEPRSQPSGTDAREVVRETVSPTLGPLAPEPENCTINDGDGEQTADLGERLEVALREGLERVGITAKVETERVPDTRLHRALVTSPQWQHLGHMDRLEVVWRIVDHAFTRDEQLYISSIWALTPDEIEGKG